MELIKPIEKTGRRYGKSIRKKSPREYIIDYLLEKENIDWLKGILKDSGILKERDRIERIIRDLERSYKENPRFQVLKEEFKLKQDAVSHKIKPNLYL